MKKILNVLRLGVPTLIALAAKSGFAQVVTQPIPTTGPALDADILVGIIYDFGTYLYTAAGIIIGITLIWSGITYLSAGSDTARVGKAKAIFKNGIIGALIVFAIGTIIATIRLLATAPGTFF